MKSNDLIGKHDTSAEGEVSDRPTERAIQEYRAAHVEVAARVIALVHGNIIEDTVLPFVKKLGQAVDQLERTVAFQIPEHQHLAWDFCETWGLDSQTNAQQELEQLLAKAVEAARAEELETWRHKEANLEQAAITWKGNYETVAAQLAEFRRVLEMCDNKPLHADDDGG